MTGILNYLKNAMTYTCEFVMEVTDKTRSDVKGGTLIQYEDNLRLLELAQVHEHKSLYFCQTHVGVCGSAIEITSF